MILILAPTLVDADSIPHSLGLSSQNIDFTNWILPLPTCSISFVIYVGPGNLPRQHPPPSLPLIYNHVLCDLALKSFSVHSFPLPLTSFRLPPLLLVSIYFPTSIIFLGCQHYLSHRFHHVTQVVKNLQWFLIDYQLSTGQI